MSMTKEQQAERRKQKRIEWKLEVQQLHRKRDERIYKQMKVHEATYVDPVSPQQKLLDQIHEKLCGPEFKAWYEVTTGEPVDDFLEEYVISFDDYVNRFRKCTSDFSQLEWTKCAIEAVARKYPWSDPEKNQYWAEQIRTATDPRDRRRILMQLATPRWANKEKVIAIYMERDRLVLETGIPHDVDHIIPIVNKKVCGLHCEFNLRVITAHDNRSKSNKFNSDEHHI